MSVPIVNILYHHPCVDGIFAALAAYLRFNKNVKDLRFVPHSVTKPMTETFHNDSHAYLLDYVGEGDFAFKLAEKIEKVTIIDHHISAMKYFESKSIPSKLQIYFDMNKSGATLALSHFSKEVDLFAGMQEKDKKRILRLYDYVEDHDLYKHQLPNTEQFIRGFHKRIDLKSDPYCFETLLSLDADKLIEEGKEGMDEVENLIQLEVSKSFTIALGGKENENFGKCLAIKTIHENHRSKLGHHLAVKSQAQNLRPIGCVVYFVSPDKLKVSMRSIENEDTTEISTKFGGGGHISASSFLIDESEFEKWKIVD
eukprot:Phypoly_transcript_12593.p1 GENE.Phypoly_transcript_12593~~Phypoly_transcript_12593.p1  ORF type:complete len:312 (+),score=48.60 Phypoly_transcript_12593:26-961(+)